MKVIKLSLLCILFAGLQIAWSGTYDLTLQEGLDGYSGTSDAYVRSQASSYNYGSSETLNLQYEYCSSWSGSVYYHARVAIKFDLDDVEIPSGATVTKAEMSLYAYNRYASLNNGAKRLYKITSSWSEGSIKYNNMPSVSSSSIASSNNSSINVWENFDVTDEIKGVIEDGDANNGFLIRFSSYSRGVSMRSSEYSTMDYRPKLVITIEDDNAPSVTVTNPLGGEQYKAGTDEFITWDAEDTRGIACRAIYLSTDNGSNYELVDSAEGNTGSYEWTIPDEVSDECLIKVFVYDEAGNSGTDISAVFAIIPAVGIITDYKFNLPIAKEYNVTILNTQGRELTSFKIQNLDQLNNIQASLSAGMHLIKISALNQTAVRKLFIAR